MRAARADSGAADTWPWAGWVASMALPLLLLAALAAPAAAQENDECLECHGKRTLVYEREGEQVSGFIDPEAFGSSVHRRLECIACHADLEDEDLPHAERLEAVDCAECHEQVVEDYATSVHAHAPEHGKTGASCVDCHGKHDIRRASDRDARIYPLNVYRVCGSCHFDVDPDTATVDELLQEPYTDDSHAHGVLKEGLIGAATCVSCHGGHLIHAKGDPESPLSRLNVDRACGKCHVGVLEQYQLSVHHLTANGDEHKGATCTDCHFPHAITAADADFRAQTAQSCSTCHAQRGGSFRQSYHGKASGLDPGRQAAACADCHGKHVILPADDVASTVHPGKLVDTCGECHEGAHDEFTRFVVHADVHDGERFPVLHTVYTVMIWLLTLTLILGGLHALLWLVRALAAGEWRRPPRSAAERYVRRWPRAYVWYHMILMTTVLTLATTGLPLHYADQGWAQNLMSFLGGVGVAGWVHRVAAVAIMGLVAVYLAHLAYRLFVKREKGVLSATNTMLPRWKDLTDLFGNLRWFLFLGPRPRYSRWTYWEKFDFWAVFWGMFVIGLSGLMLWFPVVATRYVPGWMLNVAIVVHGIEALLDIGFIFTVHVFHANLRPDKFPMDTMFLTGRIPEGEFRHERPAEYEEVQHDGKLDDLVDRTPARRTRIYAYVIGSCALAVGFFFLAMMIVALAQNGSV